MKYVILYLFQEELELEEIVSSWIIHIFLSSTLYWIYLNWFFLYHFEHYSVSVHLASLFESWWVLNNYEIHGKMWYIFSILYSVWIHYFWFIILDFTLSFAIALPRFFLLLSQFHSIFLLLLYCKYQCYYLWLSNILILI